MENTLSWPRRTSLAHWRDLVWPREHGSWSFALEPITLGLIAAPSAAGGWLALAVMAGFFARRPLRMAWTEARPDRRHDARIALLISGTIAAGATIAAIALAGVAWLLWLLPTAVAGLGFLSFDLRNANRDEAAEVLGAGAFALLPAAFAVLGGATPATAAALAAVMCGRAVPTVLCVRAAVRGAKTGVSRRAPALLTSVLAALAATGLAWWQLAPWTAAVALAVLALRTVALLVWPRPALRAKTIGMIEAGLGVAFVVAVALACP